MSRWPTFLGIGALKAGTTLLHDLLAEHPDVCLPEHRKEIHYFTEHYDRGPDWYTAHFTHCDRPVVGEISPNYLYDTRCPGRIAGAIPDVRLVVLLRDPVARAYSQFRFWVTRSGRRASFERFLEEHPNAVKRGLYHQQLMRYLDHFPRERIGISIFEDLTARTRPTVREIFRFLGADPAHEPRTGERAVYATRMRRFPRAYMLGARLSTWLYGRNLARIVAACKRTPLFRILTAPGDGEFPPITEAARLRLADAYRDDLRSLGALLDRDLARVWPLATLPPPPRVRGVRRTAAVHQVAEA